MIFKIENIFKKYKKNFVLQRFNYEFQSGLYLFIGINGSGKSTTLKILSKLINPTNNNYKISEAKVAYLCEKIEIGSTRVSTFLKSVKKLNNSKLNLKEEMKRWRLPNKLIPNLSKGNKQKCGIIMMKLAECDLYLFDEPTDALDEYSQKLFVDYIEELMKRDKIVIIATHEKSYFSGLKYTEVHFS